MALKLRSIGVPILGGVALAVACSNSESIIDGGHGGTYVANAGGTGNTGEQPSSGSTGNVITGMGGLDIVGAGGNEIVDEACAESPTVAELTPVNLIVVFDTSSSMGCNPDETSPNHCTAQWRLDNWPNRWAPVTTALRDFFGGFEGQATANGLKVAIIFFPASGNASGTCAASYKTPNVRLTSLAEPRALLTALDLAVPAGGTPTLPALYGAHELAKQLMLDDPTSQSIVILVTDGQPFVCADTSVGGPVGTQARDENGNLLVDENGKPVMITCQTIPEHNYLECRPAGTDMVNSIDDISAVASAAARRTDPKPVNTYVIGIGNETGALSSIADAGGTELIYLADGTDPSVTRETIQATLEQIRVANFDCDLKLPTPPAGEIFDPKQVNVRFIHSNGQVQDLGKSPNCAGQGWQYDVDTGPSKIMLCPQTCNAIQGDPTGELKVILGCATIVIPE